MRRSLNKVLCALGFVQTAWAVNNGLAITPQMGWNDWNAFGCNVNQDLVLNTSSAMSKYGLLAVGYEYVNIDDCWSSVRDPSNQTIIPDYTKFPNGMAYIADQLHAEGFKFGMYSDAGNKTCAGYPGSLGYEKVDADTFASWGVDYLKYDNCNNNGESGTEQITSARYEAMGNALNATGREILYSICNWGQDSPWDWGPSVGNSWRISGDIVDNFSNMSSNCMIPGPGALAGGYDCSVEAILGQAAPIASDGSKGGWNDLDMLEIGNGGMSDSEYVTHFSMWSVLKSPLIIGTNVQTLSASDFSILANPAIIAVNQDPLGMPAQNRWNNTHAQLWSGPLVSTTGAIDDVVVALVNTANSTSHITASMSDIFAGQTPRAPRWEIRDLWAGRLKDSQAQSIMSDGAAAHSSWIYNSTAVPYATGLAQRHPRLLGKSIGSVSSTGNVKVSVESHGCSILRLRALS